MNAPRTKIALFVGSIYLTSLACWTGTQSPGTAVSPGAPPTIAHGLIPVNLPDKRASDAGDADSSTTAANKEAAGGDRFSYGNYERPFNANTMDMYYPNFDIIDTQVFVDDTWVYGTITMKGRPDVKGSFHGTYGMELDTNHDGKGDWLVLVTDPASKDWSTTGVKVWEDKDHDVGGNRPMVAENNLTSTDGYEFLAFDNGTGTDPDAAWSRISPDDPNTIQLAVKRSLVDGAKEFLVGMWAGAQLDPSKFDFNDHMTHAEAGAALKGYENFYPIKGLAEMDSSCRMPVGFVPKGTEPGLCLVFIPKQPGAPAGCNLTNAVCQAQGYQGVDTKTCTCVIIG